jgi:hypothetical protein
MELTQLAAELETMRDQPSRDKALLAACVSAAHIWWFVKMHYDWQQFCCLKCGSMRIIMPSGEVQFKKRGALRWNPFVSLTPIEFPCIADQRSPLHPTRVHLVTELRGLRPNF